MANFTVIEVRKMPSAEPSRIGKFDWWVTYKVDDMHVYTVPVSEDELTEEKIKAAVAKDLEMIQSWSGKTLST
jgi:hypothetical protein